MLDQATIREHYNSMKNVWGHDHWHLITYRRLENFIATLPFHFPDIFQGTILNAGSGGNSYGIISEKMIHLDIAETHISHFPNSIISSIEGIPLENKSIDTIICIGSVLNYSDAFRSLNEFSRIVKTNGYLILDFEPSDSFEYLFTDSFSKSAAIIDTFFDGKKEKIWIYSEDYILSILNREKLSIIHEGRVHRLSPLVYRVTKKMNFSSHFASIDKIIEKIPVLKKHSCNLFLVCKKQ